MKKKISIIKGDIEIHRHPLIIVPKGKELLLIKYNATNIIINIPAIIILLL
jgi:hypothetical protein